MFQVSKRFFINIYLYSCFYFRFMKKKKFLRFRISRSFKEWDVIIFYKFLEDVIFLGEVMYKGKLFWIRKLVVLIDGRMVCYKLEKVDFKSVLVIQLIGYEVIYLEKENRRGFDVRLIYFSLEIYMFFVDFKDWVQLWVEVRKNKKLKFYICCCI